MVPDAGVGDYIVTHSGLAISIMTKEEAERAVSLLAESQENQA
jgi:hydrogenase maturation factor